MDLSVLQAEHEQLRKDFGEGQPAEIDAGLVVGPLGQDGSHTALLHPRPLVNRHLILVKGRNIENIQATEAATEAAEAPAADEAVLPSAAAADVAAPSKLRVPPDSFRAGGEAGSGPRLEDLRAAA